MIRYMILQNVMHRPLRTLITVIGVAVEVTLVILVVGLTTGLLTESAKRTEGVGADIMVQPPSASVFMAFSGAPMPIAIADKLRALQYVQAVAPVLVQFNSVNGLDIVYGLQQDTFRQVSGGFIFLAGHELQGANDILVDDIYARAKKNQSRPDAAHSGARFSRGRHRGAWQGRAAVRSIVHVAGNVRRERQGLNFLHQVRSFRSHRGRRRRSASLLPGYEIRPLEGLPVADDLFRRAGLGAFINIMIAIAVAIGFLVIFLSMYTTIIERTREIGVLKVAGCLEALHRGNHPERNDAALPGRHRHGYWVEFLIACSFSLTFFLP